MNTAGQISCTIRKARTACTVRVDCATVAQFSCGLCDSHGSRGSRRLRGSKCARFACGLRSRCAAEPPRRFARLVRSHGSCDSQFEQPEQLAVFTWSTHCSNEPRTPHENRLTVAQSARTMQTAQALRTMQEIWPAVFKLRELREPCTRTFSAYWLASAKLRGLDSPIPQSSARRLFKLLWGYSAQV